MACEQELCEYWGGDGNVCRCSLFDIDEDDRPIHKEVRDADSFGILGEGFRPGDYDWYDWRSLWDRVRD